MGCLNHNRFVNLVSYVMFLEYGRSAFLWNVSAYLPSYKRCISEQGSLFNFLYYVFRTPRLL